jgi:hypothetical protein
MTIYLFFKQINIQMAWLGYQYSTVRFVKIKLVISSYVATTILVEYVILVPYKKNQIYKQQNIIVLIFYHNFFLR